MSLHESTQKNTMAKKQVNLVSAIKHLPYNDKDFSKHF